MAVALNDLASRGTGTRSPDQHTPPTPLTAAQQSVMSSLGSRAGRYPADPVERSDRGALQELLKTRDFYTDGDQGLVDYVAERVNASKAECPAASWAAD